MTNPKCPVHGVEMQMFNYEWGEIEFICPERHE